MTKSFAQMSDWERKSYENGTAQEDVVAALLSKAGFQNVRHGTKEQDLWYDIDLVAEYEGKEVTVSVKANEPKAFSLDFVFELGIHKANDPDKFIPTWYYTGKADYYAVFKRHYSGGGELYLIKKSELVNHIAANGWKKEVAQRKDVAANQMTYKRIVKTCLGLLDKPKAVASGLAVLLISNVGESNA